MDALGIGSSACETIQAQHHGSRRNIGLTLLDRLRGPKPPQEQPYKKGLVSAAKDDAKHPSKRVANAFRRRGARMYGMTNGQTYRQYVNAPERTGWIPAKPLPFYEDVGERDD